MDPNLTSPIVLNAVLNATLNQSPQPWWTPLISPVSILVSASVGVFASLFGFRIKEQQEKRKMRLQVISQLRGYNKLLGMLYMEYGSTYGENLLCKILCENNKAAFTENKQDKLGKVSIKDQIEIDNELVKSGAYRRYEQTSERCSNVHLESAKTLKDFWAIIGLIETLFTRTKELNDKILRIEKLDPKFNKIIDSQRNSNIKDMETVTKTALDNFLTDDFGPAIDDLIDYLKSEIGKGRDLSWWQLWK